MITLTQYSQTDYFVAEELSPQEAAKLVDKTKINWLDIEDTGKVSIDEISDLFDIHHLIVEDIMNLEQLPKFERFDDLLFFTTKMLSFNQDEDLIVKEHLSIMIVENLVITFQEGLPGDAFDDLRNRIKVGKGMVRKYGDDYLFYRVLEAVVNHYHKIMEKLRSKIDYLEAKALENTSIDMMQEVIDIKKDVNLLRKYTIPMREALGKMRVEANEFIEQTSVNYFQDVQDKLDYLAASFDTSREMLRDLMDLHHSNQNNEMNRVMKTLTVVSAIFIPLTFLAGLYGMNFRNMPELNSEWGYPAVVSIMLLMAGVMAVYMRMKKWF
ncbi:MAG: magnesium and cobalt transport protein CorA [Flammeovirgaceae bacterium]|mgnify:CR=1 FL=1|nr:magnesium and cobalt transport protein CorA [Flammeovirgaceae bacterium]MBE63807.1 magnesium and cobalt transport protein CorA [Flammeovirgaceae bacterium]MBR09542.1 magnesium and cobalt transport protein CorA [Rickettsiales bacterium]HCX24938.1 magnesium and cobalt transport protein CorA [Cytophagales bacterium]|tara:strand:- start:13944 stop:14918 length:975 start_codon:yes stop_codon:yes gene_type:complete